MPMRGLPFSLSLVLTGCLLGLSLSACSGGNGGGGDAGGCPPSAPPEGSSCVFEDGLTCNYGASEGVCGGGTVAICTNGTWQYEATPSGAGAIQACPATIPAQGSPCSLSGCGAQPSCSYGCDQGGPAYATCNGSTWNVSYAGVACDLDAGDAGDGGDGGDAAEGGVSCHANADCPASDYCHAPGGPYAIGISPGPTCSSDAECSADAGVGTCGAGACVCQSSQYAQGFGRNVCSPPCANDSDCGSQLGFIYGDGTGFVCGAGGHCVPKSCSAPTDCPADFDCAANLCVRRSCTTDANCAPSGVCVDGACYPGVGACEVEPG